MGTIIMTKKKFSLSTTQIILISFLITILLGSILLSLPVSSANGTPVSYVDALFTATTSTCVTGLVTLPTFSSWSVFGQAVILILIQIGGLGVITVMTGFMLLLHKRMGIGDRLLIQDAFNLNTMSGLAKIREKHSYRHVCYRRRRCASLYDGICSSIRFEGNMDIGIQRRFGFL